jgi:hypothetical protein
MPARLKAQGIKAHPMLEAIVKAAIAGDSCRKIAEWVDPPVSVTAISRYIKDHVRPVMGSSDAISALLKPNSDVHSKTEHVHMPEPSVPQMHKIAAEIALSAPALHIRDNRLKLQQDIANRLLMVIEDRAAAYANAPGGRSGLLAMDYKGAGEDMREVYKVDTGVLSELRELQKQIATELGQWQEPASQAVSIQILWPGDRPESTPRVSYSPDVIQIEADNDPDEARIGVRQLK